MFEAVLQASSTATVATSVTGILLASVLSLAIRKLYLTYRHNRILTTSTALACENPYGNVENARSFPYEVRFLRLTLQATGAGLESVSATARIKDEIGRDVDCPGQLHWQRQPREGVPHPLELHTQISSPQEAARHMHDFHFSYNSPVPIRKGRADKIDLLMRIKGYDNALATVSREQTLAPGKYFIRVVLDCVLEAGSSANNPDPIMKFYEVRIGEGFPGLSGSETKAAARFWKMAIQRDDEDVAAQNT